MNQFKWLSLILLLILSLSVSLSNGQGGVGGSDDGGGMDQDQQDQGQDVADPNVANTPNQQGYGKDVPTHITKKETKPMKVSKFLTPPIGEQSILAMQQFAVLVGVALMVGILFMLNIGLDLFMDWCGEKLTDLFCKKKVVDDAENPAALVGTFKRYK